MCLLYNTIEKHREPIDTKQLRFQIASQRINCIKKIIQHQDYYICSYDLCLNAITNNCGFEIQSSIY